MINPNKQILAIVIVSLLSTSAPAVNNSTATSTGNNNDVTVFQTGANLSSNIFQIGNRNKAETIQSVEGNSVRVKQGGDDNYSIAVQTGIANLATVDQIFSFDIGNNNISQILQIGDENVTTLKQDIWDVSYISQSGDNNSAFVDQTGLLGDGHNKSTINQDGNSNETTVTQNSTQNAATVNQEGNNSLAEVTQGGSRNHIATINQKGDGNRTDVAQTGLRNTATINQDDNNIATVLQDGIGTFTGQNTVLINQEGRSNMAVAEQHGGLGNNTTISQDGRGVDENSAVINNMSTVIQTGAFNNATVSQQP